MMIQPKSKTNIYATQIYSYFLLSSRRFLLMFIFGDFLKSHLGAVDKTDARKMGQECRRHMSGRSSWSPFQESTLILMTFESNFLWFKSQMPSAFPSNWFSQHVILVSTSNPIFVQVGNQQTCISDWNLCKFHFRNHQMRKPRLRLMMNIMENLGFMLDLHVIDDRTWNVQW